MCTHGEGGRLQISAATATLVPRKLPNAILTQRGVIVIKGRGEMITYWVDPDFKPASEPESMPTSQKEFDDIVLKI